MRRLADRPRCLARLLVQLCVLMQLAGAARLQAQSANPNFWVTNGPVRSEAISGKTLYIGGDFNYVGPPTGSFAAFDSTNDTSLQRALQINGSVNVCVPDGRGGCFIGGLFSTVAGFPQIGRASCRERVEISGVAVALKKKEHLKYLIPDIKFYSPI